MTQDDDILVLGPVTFRPGTKSHFPRMYVRGHRVHHGPIALVWLLTDVRDARRWFPDLFRRWA